MWTCMETALENRFYEKLYDSETTKYILLKNRYDKIKASFHEM